MGTHRINNMFPIKKVYKDFSNTYKNSWGSVPIVATGKFIFWVFFMHQDTSGNTQPETKQSKP